MGACTSHEAVDPEEQKRKREEKIRDRWISEMMTDQQEKDHNLIKLLFLGAGESGKSTLMKQMQILHGGGFVNAADRLPYVPLIHQNILQSAQVLARQSMILGSGGGQTAAANMATVPAGDTSHFHVAPDAEPARDLVLEVKFDDPDPLKPAVVEAIKILWADDGIQATFEMASTYQLNDSTEYFMTRLDDVVQQGYVPNEQDILRARIRTTGIVEHRFIIDKNDFRIFDVGGQRNARKKWIHCFESVASIIFVAALSGYDQALYEDRRTNRMHEALNLFDDIVNSQWFVKTSIILFLNKKDIFRKKMANKVPLTKCFPDYDGEATYRAGCKHIKAAFRERVKNPNKRIYTHFTCATDTQNVDRVFNSVKHIILRTHLMEVGLVDQGTQLQDYEEEPMD